MFKSAALSIAYDHSTNGHSTCCVVWGLPEETDCARLVGGVNQMLLSPDVVSNQQSSKASIPTLGNRQVLTSLLEQGNFDQINIRFVESTHLMTLLHQESKITMLRGLGLQPQMPPNVSCCLLQHATH